MINSPLAKVRPGQVFPSQVRLLDLLQVGTLDLFHQVRVV